MVPEPHRLSFFHGANIPKGMKCDILCAIFPRDFKNLTNIPFPMDVIRVIFSPRLMNLVHTILCCAAQQVISGKRRTGQLPKLHRARPLWNDSRPWPFLSWTAHTPIRGGIGSNFEVSNSDTATCEGSRQQVAGQKGSPQNCSEPGLIFSARRGGRRDLV